jgi:Protein of unknown function (DUF1059)
LKRALQCDCGFEARGEDEDGLVAEVQRHARDGHGMSLSSDEALLLAFRADLADAAWPRTPTTDAQDDSSETTSRREER